jgi:hypothetical protein
MNLQFVKPSSGALPLHHHTIRKQQISSESLCRIHLLNPGGAVRGRREARAAEPRVLRVAGGGSSSHTSTGRPRTLCGGQINSVIF